MLVRCAFATLVATTASVLALPAGAASPSVRIVSVTHVVAKGGQATLVAQVTPVRARCSLSIYLRSGLSAASGLRVEQAVKGRVTWTWTVSRSTTGGTFPIYVECGPTGIAKTTFTIAG